jgi:hypothetical protein
MSDIVITDGKFVEVFTDLISEYTEEIADATSLEIGEKAYTKATDVLDIYEKLLESDGNYHPEVEVEMKPCRDQLEEAFQKCVAFFDEGEDE